MTEETKRTDIVAALERAAYALEKRWKLPEGFPDDRASAALLRSLAARITDYREAWDAWTSPEGVPAVLQADRALLALARGDTPNHTEHPTDD